MNDDSCPECDDLGIPGWRRPCVMASPPNVVQPVQTGCRLNVWPYFQAVWLFDMQPTDQVFRIEAYQGDRRIAMTELGVP